MKTFTIETETNNITLHATLEDAQAVLDSEQFGSAEDLAGLASEWATARLIDIWNGIPGVTPVSKFKDKKTAVTRIWNAIQSLGEETEPGFGDVQECAEREGKTVDDVLEVAYEPQAETTAESAPLELVESEPVTSEPDANVGEQGHDVAPVE